MKHIRKKTFAVGAVAAVLFFGVIWFGFSQKTKNFSMTQIVEKGDARMDESKDEKEEKISASETVEEGSEKFRQEEGDRSVREEERGVVSDKKPVQKEAAAENSKETLSSDSTIHIVQKRVSWGFERVEKRDIDTVVIHSSYNSLGGKKYDTEAVTEIYKTYGVSPHYLVDRDGIVYRLVEEKNIAYHAGAAKLPDGRTNVNAVSIGIEVLNDDKGDAYTDAQYASLRALIADIKNRHSIRYVLGHSDVAPGRKTDPWSFDWKKMQAL